MSPTWWQGCLTEGLCATFGWLAEGFRDLAYYVGNLFPNYLYGHRCGRRLG